MSFKAILIAQFYSLIIFIWKKEILTQVFNVTAPPRILVVDDTAFNVLAVKYLVKDNFNLEIDSAVNG